MHRRTARLNRVLLVVVGVALLAAGGFLLARHYDWIDSLPSTDRLYSRTEARWLHDHSWIWFAVAAAATVAGLIALYWLLVQQRIDRVRTLRLDPDPDQAGRTVMSADVLTDAVVDDITDYPGVHRARALLIGDAEAPELILRVATHPGADLVRVRHEIVDDALPALRAALDAETVPVQLHLLVAKKPDNAERTVV